MPPVPRPGARKGPNRNLLLALGGAAVVAIVLIVASLVLRGGDSASPSTTGTSTGGGLFSGIPQDFTLVGKPNARVKLIEYGDLQCPICKSFSADTLPSLVDEYVRPGRVKMEFRGIAFIGPDSEKALRFVIAAGLQDSLWEMQEGLYANQGGENKGWVTDELVRSVASEITGLDIDQLFADVSAPEVTKELQESDAQAQAAKVPGTPWFWVQIGDSEPYEIQPTSYAPDFFRQVLDDALTG